MDAPEDPGASALPRPARMSNAEQAVAAVVLAWTTITVVEMATAIAPFWSLTFTIAEAAGAVVYLLAVIQLARTERPSRGDDDDTRRRNRLRSYALFASLATLLILCLAGQLDVVLQVRRGADASHLSSSYVNFVVMAFLLVVVGAMGSPRRLSRLLASVAHRPARLMASTFGLAALVGALLLTLPVSLRHVEDASLVDALFNSMSAVCVTGLAVNNVAEAYTPFGQFVIMVLIQVGGLGIMVLFGFFSVLSGQHLRAKHAAAMAELLDVRSFAEMRRMLFRIVVFTFAVEAVGAALLYVGFAGHPEISSTAVESSEPLAGAGNLLWAAVFHSVSAFCNAGFSIFRDGALPFGNETFVPFVLGILIILGGIGFPVAIEVASHLRARIERQRHARLTLHARVVLWTTAALVVAGSVMFWLLESRGAMSHLGWGHRLVAAFFQSVACRTAGFSTIDFSIVAPPALLFGCALMMVGASPGSTGGGIKTTTLATLLAVLRSELRRSTPEIGGRRIGLETVRRAVAVVMVSVLVVGVALFLLLLVEDMEPMKLAFEAISAYTTTGLSTGITADLSHLGKMLLTLTMFAGRIGPLTLALAVSQRTSSARLGLVEERIAIG